MRKKGARRMREEIIERILEKKIIAIARDVCGEAALSLAHALYEGGIELLEFTFDQKKIETHSETCKTIEEVAKQMEGKLFVGAGTVTSVKLVEMAAQAGARFIVSPDTDVEVIRKTREYSMVSLPGALTPTEVQMAHRAGADFVKLFPVSQLGSSYVKALSAPLNHVRLLAVGGVNETNMNSFLSAGACGVGVGGNLVNREWIESGEFCKITLFAKKMTENLSRGV